MNKFKVTDDFNNSLQVYVFDDVIKCKGIVQLVHGINEHGMRYEEFALYLNSQGYIVYIHDHVSQGLSRTYADKDVVYFGKNGRDVLVNGLNIVRSLIKKDNPGMKIFVFGHSLGSMVIRKYLLDFDNEYEKIVLNGGGFTEAKGLGFIILVGNVLKLFKKRKPSNFFDNIFRQTQLKLNKKVEIDHFIEWLTRDKEKTKINLTDSYLYIRLSVSVFVDMLKMIKEINNIKKIKLKRVNTKILVMSGTHDAATNFGEDTKRLNDVFNDVGYDSTLILYQEGRHDTLQEINRKEVFKDITTFFEDVELV